MKAAGSDQMVIYIAERAKERSGIVANLLAMYCLSGCDTVAPLFRIGKRLALKTLMAGHS